MLLLITPALDKNIRISKETGYDINHISRKPVIQGIWSLENYFDAIMDYDWTTIKAVALILEECLQKKVSCLFVYKFFFLIFRYQRQSECNH